MKTREDSALQALALALLGYGNAPGSGHQYSGLSLRNLVEKVHWPAAPVQGYRHRQPAHQEKAPKAIQYRVITVP